MDWGRRRPGGGFPFVACAFVSVQVSSFLYRPYSLRAPSYCKEILHNTLPTREEIYKRETKYCIPHLRSTSSVADPLSSSQSGTGGLHAPFLIFPISVSPRNCKIAPVAFYPNNSDIFLFLRRFRPSFLHIVVHSTLIQFTTPRTI